MADSNETEVFDAKLGAETSGLKDAIKVLEAVQKVTNDTLKGLKTLEGLKIAPDLSGFSDNTKKAKDEIKSLSSQMSELKKQVIEQKMAGGIVNPDDIAKLAQYKKVLQEVNQATAAVKEKPVKIELGPIEGPQRLGDAVKELPSLLQQFQNVGETAQVADRSLGTMFKDFKDGLALIQGGGNTFVGIQQAMFGVTGASGTLGKVFGFLAKGTDEVGKANERLAQAGIRASSQMAQFSSVLTAQSKILKDVAAKELGLDKSTFNSIDQQIQKVEKAYKDMTTTIEGGGKPTSQQLSRIKTETAALEQKFIELKQQGIIPAGTATDDLIKELVEGAAKGRNATSILVQQYRAMADAVTKAEEKQKSSGSTAEKQASIFQRLFNSLNIFSKGAKDSASSVNELASASKSGASAVSGLNDEVEQGGSAFKTFLAAFSGGFLGAALGGLDLIKNNLAGIANAFYEPNKAVQDFRITMANMMKGTGLDVEETQGRIESFVRDVVAKTPFELTDAFESFQKLLISGFDPQKWLVPVADAAAAVNKPMEQLIGGMAKIQVGAKGAGIDMLRDFGIPVNQVGAFVDKATGQMLAQDQVLNDNVNLYNLSAEELDKMGISFNKLEFDKQGALINSSGDALNILNGYLQQNATFAGAAEGRSRSLGGVISNLKDFVTNLSIAVGQPIFEKLTVAGQGLLDKLNILQPTLTSFATTIGTSLANGLDYAVNLINNFSLSFDSLPPIVQNIVATFDALFQGDWASAWGYFLTVVDDSLTYLSDNIGGFIDSAFNWGYSLGEQLASGIYDAASSILNDALTYIGDTISSFLAPGSPPEQGPLSTIDKWGAPLAEMYTDSIQEGLQTKPIIDALNPVASLLSGQSGPLATQLGKENAIAAQFKKIQDLRSKLAQAQKLGLPSAEAIKSQIADAEAEYKAMTSVEKKATGLTGAVTPAKTGGGKKAGGGGGGGGEGAGAGKKGAETFQDKFAKEKAALEERKKQGLISQADYLKEMLKLEQDYVKKSQEEGLTAGLEEHVKAVKDLGAQSLQEEKNQAFQRFKNGVTSEEEYTKEVLKIEEKAANDKLALGQQLSKEEMNRLKLLNDEVEAFKKKGKKSGGPDETGKVPTAGEILSGFGLDKVKQDLGENLAGIAGQAGTTFVESLREATKTKFADFKKDVQDQFASLKDDINTGLSNIGLSPALLALGATVGGVIAIFSGFGGILLYTIPIIGIITLAILNWDTVTQGLSATFNFFLGIFDRVANQMGGREKLFETFSTVFYSASEALRQFGKIAQKALGQLFTGDFSGAADTFQRIFSEIDTSAITSGLKAISEAIGGAIWQSLPSTFFVAIGKVKQVIAPALSGLSTAFNSFFSQGRLGGELLDLFTSLFNLFKLDIPVIITVLEGFGVVLGTILAVILDVAASLVNAFAVSLPFIEQALTGVVQVFTGFIESITAGITLIKAGFFALTGDTTTAKELLKQAFTEMGQAAADIFGGLLRTITNTGLSILSFLTTFFLSLVAFPLTLIPGFDKAGQAILGFSTYVVSLMQSMSDGVFTVLDNFYQYITGLFLGLYNYLVGESIVPDMVTEILKWISSLGPDGLAFFSDAIDSWIKSFEEKIDRFAILGKGIIDGLIQGMRDHMDAVWNFLGDLVQEAIDTVKSRFGIHSPSLVFQEIGANLVEGLSKGVELATPSFVKTITGKTKEITKAFFPIVEGNKLLHRSFTNYWNAVGESSIDALNKLVEQGKLDPANMQAAIEARVGRKLIGPAVEGVKNAAPEFIKAFKEMREKALREFDLKELERGMGIIDFTDKIVENFDKALAKVRQTAFINLDLATNLTGQDITGENVKNFFDAIKGGQSFGANADQAILDAYNAQQKLNASLEEQKKIQEAQLKLEQQRSRLDFLRSQLELVQQAKDAGVDKSLIAGLTLGADSLTSDVLNQMSKITQAIIDKTQKDFGISSPSKVFMKIGTNLTAGLNMGLEYGSKEVSKAVTGINALLGNVGQPVASRPTNFQPAASNTTITKSAVAHITQNIGSKLDAALVNSLNQQLFNKAFN